MVPTSDLAAATSATYGGRFEAGLVGVACEMAQADIASNYATVFTLLGLTAVYACDRFDVVDCDPGEFRALLRDTASWYDPATWRRWGMTSVVLRPHGEPLPVATNWGATFGLSVTPLDLRGGTGCWAWPDVLAAVAEGADPDRIELIRVFTILPVGTQPGLQPLRLPTGRLVDLTREDLGQVLIAERARIKHTGPAWLGALLKAVANALCYGGLARTDPRSFTDTVTTVAYGPSGQRLATSTRTPETPGPHQFLPAAAAVCAGARLLIAMIRRDVGDAHGVVAAVHADSFTVPCSIGGGWLTVPGTDEKLRILAVGELTDILDRFRPLGVTFGWEVSPSEVPSVGLVVAVNRVLVAQPDSAGGWTVVRSSDSGLGGHLADPSDTPGGRQDDGRWAWTAQIEAALFPSAVATSESDRGLTGDRSALPSWCTRPVIRRYTASSYTRLAQLRADSGDPTLGPFARYLRAGTAIPGGPVAIGPWPHAASWGDADWRLAGNRIGLDTHGPDGITPVTTPARGSRIAVESLHSYLATWATPTDPKTTGPRRGHRTPRPVHSAPGHVDVVGRDGTELLTADHDPTGRSVTDATLVYGTDTSETDPLRAQVRTHGIRRVAQHAELPYETVRAWTTGAATGPATLAAILDTLTVLAAQPDRTCRLPGCTRPARRRSPWCGDTHKKAGNRRTQRQDQS